MRVLSLGAGVQSTTIALMAACGEIERPDCAIFADTGWEPKAVYGHLERLTAALPFPVHVVRKGNLRDDIMSAAGSGSRVASVPWFTAPNGIMPRQCTADYKIAPIAKKLRELLGVPPRKKIPNDTVEIWIGISLDEAVRMRPARQRWQRNRWPLIERGMHRHDCVAWLERAGWSAPRSACIGCPYHSDSSWRALRDGSPGEWADTLAVDRAIRSSKARVRAQMYMHRSRAPLSDVDLSTPAERGQGDLWGEECEGVCGV